MELSDFDRGVLMGILVTEGSFGGDGKQPQVVLRMHTRHERLVRWIHERVPDSRLYGPYHHGGRSYFQWMARGPALVPLLPLLEDAAHRLDDHAVERLEAMLGNYAEPIARMRRLTDAG